MLTMSFTILALWNLSIYHPFVLSWIIVRQLHESHPFYCAISEMPCIHALIYFNNTVASENNYIHWVSYWCRIGIYIYGIYNKLTVLLYNKRINFYLVGVFLIQSAKNLMMYISLALSKSTTRFLWHAQTPVHHIRILGSRLVFI